MNIYTSLYTSTRKESSDMDTLGDMTEK